MTLSKTELASMFDVPISQLGWLGRHGAVRRLGADRYLLDYDQSATLLKRQGRARGTVVPSRRLRMRSAGAVSREGSEPAADPSGWQQVTNFFQDHGGLQTNSVNIVNVPDVHCATLAAGAFLGEGLQRGERVAMVGFEHPDKVLGRLAGAGFALEQALHAEQLIYLYYRPDVAHSISLSVDYRELFGEILRFAGDDARRVLLFNVDALINANSEHLVHTSLHQMIFAANHFHLTLLGLFVDSGHVAELLDEGCRALLPGYFVME